MCLPGLPNSFLISSMVLVILSTSLFNCCSVEERLKNYWTLKNSWTTLKSLNKLRGLPGSFSFLRKCNTIMKNSKTYLSYSWTSLWYFCLVSANFSMSWKKYSNLQVNFVRRFLHCIKLFCTYNILHRTSYHTSSLLYYVK